MRNLPRGVRWHPRLGGRTGEFEPVRAAVLHRCHHVGPLGQVLPGPCVGAIVPQDVYIRVEHTERMHTRLAMRCAVLAEIVIDSRLTPTLIETLACARGGILLWLTGIHDDMVVWIKNDAGQAEFNAPAQAAALWLHRNGFVRLPTDPGDALIVATAAGRAEFEAWKKGSVSRFRL
jgi:hypothetical protein